MSSTGPHRAPTLAVIGGGQLARMMAQPAIALGLPLRLLAEAEGVSAAQVIPDQVVGDYTDLATLRRVTEGAGRRDLRPRARADRAPARARGGRRRRTSRPGRARPRPGQGRDAPPARGARRAVPAQRRRHHDRRGRGLRPAVRPQDHPRRLRRQGRVGRPRPRRGAGGLRRRGRCRRGGAGRGARRLPARALRPRRPLAQRPGRGVPGRRLDPARRHLPRGHRPRAGPLARPGRSGAGDRPARRRCARRHGHPRRRALRDDRRPDPGQRAGDAPPQHRPLDPGRRRDVPVRESSARRHGPPARVRRPRVRAGP